jgi:HNH endonuclease
MKEVPVGKHHVALVDDEDYERVAAHRWSYRKGYAANSRVGLMHIFIMQPHAGRIVHHREGDKLDNRRSELEVVTHAEHGLRHSGDRWRGRAARRPASAKAWTRTVDLPAELRPVFEELAKQNAGSVNREIVMACREYAQRHAGHRNGKAPKRAERMRPGQHEDTGER